jgi:hypothetical protein
MRRDANKREVQEHLPALKRTTPRIYVCSATAMDRFIHRKKLEHYLRLLTQTADEAQREQLLKLLAEEEMTAQQPPREGGKQDRQTRP